MIALYCDHYYKASTLLGTNQLFTEAQRDLIFILHDVLLIEMRSYRLGKVGVLSYADRSTN